MSVSLPYLLSKCQNVNINSCPMSLLFLPRPILREGHWAQAGPNLIPHHLASCQPQAKQVAPPPRPLPFS